MNRILNHDSWLRRYLEPVRVLVSLLVLLYMFGQWGAYRNAFFVFTWGTLFDSVTWFLLFCVYIALPLFQRRIPLTRNIGIFLGALISLTLLLKIMTIGIVYYFRHENINNFGSFEHSILFISLTIWTGRAYFRNWVEFGGSAFFITLLAVGILLQRFPPNWW